MKNMIPAWLRVTVLFCASFGAMEYFIDSGDRPAFIKYPIICVVLLVFLFVLIALELIWEAIDKVTWMLLTEEQKKEKETADALPIREKQWYKNLMQKLTRTEPMETEQTVLLHHEYDGIRELDNKLPPWWVYSFYATIVFAGIYLVKYHMLGGADPETELRQEIAAAKIAIEEYKKTAPDLMDEEKVTLLTDADALGKGKAIFETNCAACHRADGGGQIGPNLTDEYWILGGGIKNVFHTINKGGRDGKGMIAWGGNLKPTEIQYVASYVLSLQGSNPKDGKAADGEVWKE